MNGIKPHFTLYTDLIHGIYQFLPLVTIIECSRVQHLWNYAVYHNKFTLKANLDMEVRPLPKLRYQLRGLTQSRIKRHITSLKCYDFNSDALEVLFECLPCCLLLERLDLDNCLLDNSIPNLCQILPQCMRLTTVYLGRFMMCYYEIIINVIPLCKNLQVLQFSVIDRVDKLPKHKLKLREDILQIFTSVIITQQLYIIQSDLCIVTASGRI